MSYLINGLLVMTSLAGMPGCFQATKEPATAAGPTSPMIYKGVSLVAPVKPAGDSIFTPLVQVGANSVALMPFAFCSPEAPAVRYNGNGHWWGETTGGVASCIGMARARGLTVMLKPQLWIGRGTYTGDFTLSSERDWQLWERGYQNYILHFAALADSMKADLFCIGTELGTTIRERPAFWDSLIDSVKQVYHGKLTYAANWDDYPKVPFWKELDFIGVDAYFPLAKERAPGVSTLKKGWDSHLAGLQKVSRQNGRPILFTEYGYRNVDYAAAEPWKEVEGGRNDAAQAAAYEAMFQSLAGKEWFAGGYLWKWYPDSGRHRRPEIDFTPQGKPAQQVIAEWYGK